MSGMVLPVVIRVLVKRGGWVHPARDDRRKCPDKRKNCCGCKVVHDLVEVPIGKVWCLAYGKGVEKE
jgi:hypothetical protein